jgi:hypothetical protein
VRLAVPGNEGVQVDELRESVGGPISDTGRNHAAVAMTDEYHVA